MKYFVIGLLSYVFFMGWLVPASYLSTWFLPENAPVKLYNISGTLSQGKASAIEVQGQQFFNVRWQLSAWSLLTGQVRLQLNDSERNAANVSINLLGTITLRNVHLKRNGAALNQYFPAQLRQNQLYGQFVLKLKQAQWSSDQLSMLDGRLTWRNATLKTMLGETDLGEVVLTVKGDDEQGLTGKLTDTKQRVGLNSRFSWQPDGQFSCKGTTLPEAELPEKNVANLLKLFAKAKPDQSGKLAFEYTASLPWPAAPQPVVTDTAPATEEKKAATQP